MDGAKLSTAGSVSRKGCRHHAVGVDVGLSVGWRVGLIEGDDVLGRYEGAEVGKPVGWNAGSSDGLEVAAIVGVRVGGSVATLGGEDGREVGDGVEGPRVGTAVVGELVVGVTVGRCVKATADNLKMLYPFRVLNEPVS